MGDVLATELAIRTTGTTEAVANLKQVAAASQTMTTQVNHSAEGLSHLERVMFRMSGGNRELRHIFGAISEAAQSAEGNMGKFRESLVKSLTVGGLAAGAVASFKWLEHSIEDVNTQLEQLGYKKMGALEMLWKSISGGKLEVDEEATASIRTKGEKSYVQKIMAELSPEPLEAWALRHAENYWQQHHVQIPARLLFADIEAQKRKMEEDAFWKKTGEAFKRAAWQGKDAPGAAVAEVLALHEKVKAMEAPTEGGRMDMLAYYQGQMAQQKLAAYGQSPEEQLDRARAKDEAAHKHAEAVNARYEEAQKEEAEYNREIAKLRNASIRSLAAGKGEGEAGAELMARSDTGDFTRPKTAQELARDQEAYQKVHKEVELFTGSTWDNPEWNKLLDKYRAADKAIQNTTTKDHRSTFWENLGSNDDERKAMFEGIYEATSEAAHEQVRADRKRQDTLAEDYAHPKLAGAAGLGSVDEYRTRIEAQTRMGLQNPGSQDESVKRLEDIRNYNKIMADAMNRLVGSEQVAVFSIGSS